MVKVIAGGKYKLTGVIAAGSFGKVYEDGAFAIKEIRVPGRLVHSRAISAIIANEIRILTQLNHENTVKLYEVIQEGDYIYMVMELCQGDLRSYTEYGAVGQRKVCEHLKNILKGYGELARLGIVHRDLKPANILLKEGNLKIADFGMSRWEETGRLLRSHVGTPYYMAPQVLQRIDYTRKCDVWSMGIIFYELLFGCLPWNAKDEESLLNAIMTQPLKISGKVSEGVKEIVEGMLSISEARRLSFTEVEKLLTFEFQMGANYEEKSYHWSVAKELVMLEAEFHSKLRFKTSYESLSMQERREVKAELLTLFRQEEAYMLNYLS